MSNRIETQPGPENSVQSPNTPAWGVRFLKPAIDLGSYAYKNAQGGARVGLAIVAAAGASAVALLGMAAPDATAIFQAWNSGKNQAKSGKSEDPSRGNTENAASAQQTGGIYLKPGYKRVHIAVVETGQSDQTPGTATPPAESTPTPPATATPRPETPTQTPTPEQNPYYADWPAGLANLVANLPGLENVRYVRYPSPSQAPNGLRNTGAGWDSKNVYFVAGGPLANGEVNVVGHEACHKSQLEEVLAAGLDASNQGDEFGDTRVRNWPRTPKGEDFVTASRQVVSEAQASGNPMPWPTFGQDPVQDYANMCRAYFDSREGPDWVNHWSALGDFFRQWLPKNGLLSSPKQSVASR